MRKKKDLLDEKVGNKIIYLNNVIKISREGNKWFFEIGNELTTDIAEAVSILMRKCDSKDTIWNIEIKDINTNELEPSKSLFWLSGGPNEWKLLENYKKPWCDCHNKLQNKFGSIVLDIVKTSKTLGEIKNGFIKNLNLPRIYDYALSINIIK